MRLFLDTNALIWSRSAPERLGAARDVIEDAGNELLVSVVVAWEIAIKWSIGRLELPAPPAFYVPDRVRALGGSMVPITSEHALGVAALPLLHRDPFDRLLVSQAQELGATLVTADAVIAEYDVETLLV